MEVANKGKSVGILSAAPSSAGLQLGGSGNPQFTLAADTTNNKLDSMAQIHGSTSTTGQGELTLSTQGLDSSGNVARGTINLVADTLKLNGEKVILTGAKIFTGTMVLNGVGNNSVRMWTISQLKSLYGIDYAADRTVIIANNGDGQANAAHVEGVTYMANDQGIYAVLNYNISIGALIRINFAIIHGVV